MTPEDFPRAYALALLVLGILVAAARPRCRQSLGRWWRGLAAAPDRQCDACLHYQVRAAGPDWCLRGGITRPSWSCAGFETRHQRQMELLP